MLGSLSYKVNFKYILERKNAGIKAIGTKHFKFIKPKIQKLTMFPKGHKKQQKKKKNDNFNNTKNNSTSKSASRHRSHALV